eukprot:CAMPEP_0177764206 /NCGR_PEP_ID=MMETSP0491_2-20121128/7278_1 /TAXON_ID=63592 /ORGANISM="Tetraselmis chuii, Strain PLY429" /LENGTH=118 /DNA_ID=CAMNT_0019280359 /DNA_START=419 /DNA_END=772 /DNA_ORIENTATION=+
MRGAAVAGSEQSTSTTPSSRREKGVMLVFSQPQRGTQHLLATVLLVIVLAGAALLLSDAREFVMCRARPWRCSQRVTPEDDMDSEGTGDVEGHIARVEASLSDAFENVALMHRSPPPP